MLLGLLDRKGAEVKDRCCQDCAGFTFGNGIGEVIKRASTAGGDYGDFDRFAYGLVELVVETCLGAVGVHAGEEDLTCT